MKTNMCCKTRQQIAVELNISYATLYRRLKNAQIEVPSHRLLSPAEYEPIFALFTDKSMISL